MYDTKTRSEGHVRACRGVIVEARALWQDVEEPLQHWGSTSNTCQFSTLTTGGGHRQSYARKDFEFSAEPVPMPPDFLKAVCRNLNMEGFS